jgi:KipI family sensor histidine kinase inhibitor
MVPLLKPLLAELQQSASVLERPVRHHRLVVNYGGTAGQDLDWLAGQTGLSTTELINLHSSALYTVEFLGFLPGFAYLSGLPDLLHFPRRSTPRARVPAGTLAVGARYCAVYPVESPGGWHLLGHVEQVLFDPEAADAQGRSLLHAGDTVEFIQA